MISAGSSNSLTAELARALAAKVEPLVPIDVPPAATACHECDEVPGTHVAILTPDVGTFQDTSPTSVEPFVCDNTSG